ncbi:MAG: thiamine phosphate synthase [Archaeoglobaceae archaeon]|nr:thiamine phosphate synthase [Archaeoglobaceae archaeon]MCX8151756.1 thiamine phosphate synthase [Archaeoglobaceae archaeon]MDW8014274.1 thiamine phosphate synthase [Archaeoglobaceae archaeon]
MKKKLLMKKLRLYVITDRTLKPEIESVKAALEGGATAIQLRIKNASTKEMFEIGKKIRELTEECNALYVVNDRLDVALATEADGVHLGSNDLPVSVAKRIAPDLIVGASTNNLEAALKAEADGADYLGVGSVFPTSTKRDAKVIGLENFKNIKRSVRIPVIAIGGIDHGNVLEVLKAGADGIAVISAVMAAEDVRDATAKFRKILDSFFGNNSY